MTKIKFCGMKRAEDARTAEELGANFVGVILTKSPRKVSVEEAIKVFESAPSLRRVGVIGRLEMEGIAKSARNMELDILQLHGAFSSDEFSRLRDDFDGEIWAVTPVDEQSGKLIDTWRSTADVADALLLDTSVRGKSGGTGAPFNWSRARPAVDKVSKEIPIVLAGGLNPENVGIAIDVLHPSVVDVSSGVESAPGVKDPELMRAFANAVRSASIV